ncbi:MAG: DUF11 domain-containing protein [Burkholderiaceae bacterium]|uniref:DUF11 domain-containing protein n=1 Tax=Hydrogenophaga sp. TaxID=1904254 RepID=UPI002745A8AC|nr:DUF11 domain-containing protein [Hydrogenophaga sp.]MDP2064687.1 DUF11 domain-containing protein [Burkholderiaceae bacterium]MDZ4144599.1 DUF11 domain-containing protein [Burkholderiales bacterium]MDZ4399486.1 DUF11 domain-containing protein [Hydrogenophaga sp.]
MKVISISRQRLQAGVLSSLLVLAAAWIGNTQAQTIYGVGDSAINGTNYSRLFSINPATGAATNLCALSFPSTAMGASGLDGLVYYVERADPATPRINAINPQTCVNGTPVATTLPAAQIRATACPDGRFYAATNTNQFFEVNVNTGATVRTLNWAGLPTGGSGDFSCVNNGDMYILAADGTANYNLYRATAASFQTLANGGTVNVTNLGDVGLPGAPNGLTDGPVGAGCAAAPNPCLYASTGATNQTWRINALTAAATNAGTTGGALTDLSRTFALDLAFTKTVSPSTALQGQTVFYTLTASNSGPGVVRSITVTDVFPPAFTSVAWSCSVVSAGDPNTLVATSCGVTPTGTGTLNNTASLSLNGSIRYDVTATLSSSFTGTLTNAGQATLTALVTDLVPSNNASTVTSTITPATHLQITKTNAVGTVTAGQTTSYTITVANGGPADAPNTVVRDPAAPGLICTAVSCAVTAGTATCPAAPTIAVLQGTGLVLPTFNANATVTFGVTCGVTATGQ